MRTCRRLSLIICAVVLPTCAILAGQDSAAPAVATRPAPVEPLGPLARQFVQTLAKGEYTRAEGYLDATMKAALPAPKLKTLWESLVTQGGPFQAIPAIRQEKQQGFNIVVLTCRFEKTSLDMKVVFDGAGKVSGLWVSPALASQPYSPPAYADPGTFVETEAIVGTGEWTLPATLAMPKGDGPFPAVVLVHGSGPHDRDEAIGPNKPFRDLAWGLASKGIAVLRYEKRTKAHQAKLRAVTAFTVKQETIEDVLAAVSLLRQTRDIDAKRIFVLGHSLGGMLAPRIAKADPAIAGLVILAGSTRPFEDVYLAQVHYMADLDGTLSEEDKAHLKEVSAAVARVKSLTPADVASKDLLLDIPASYWLDLRGYEPARMARDLPQPMLILQGGRDYQVTDADLALWRKALADRPAVQIRVYPQMSHLFIAGSGKPTPADYDKPGHVDPEVITDIATWIKAQQ